MNAAARAIHKTDVFSGRFVEIRLSKSICVVFILLCLVLLSAISVVYVTNEHRICFSHLQQLEQQTQRLEIQWGKLLLEQASLATPARVAQLAVEKLHMNLPADNDIFVLRNEK